MNSQSPTTESDADSHGHGQVSRADDRRPPASSFFPGIAYSAILERLYRLTEEAEEVALLTGVQGAGKTTLLYRIQSDTPEHWVPCRVDANPMLHPDQLLERLARCIDLPTSDEGVVDDIAAVFCKLRLRGYLPVVMVDDAEQLPISSLMSLLHLHEQRVAEQPACALILLAQPEIDAALSTHQLHAMGTARFVRLELPRLAEGETADYVRHFLRMEGIEQPIAFSPRQLAALHSESDGLPGKVNELVIRSLRDAIVNRHDPLATRLYRKLRHIPPVTALTAGAVILLLLSTLLLQPQSDTPSQETAPVAGLNPSAADARRKVQISGGAVSEQEERRVIRNLELPPTVVGRVSGAEPAPPTPKPESTPLDGGRAPKVVYDEPEAVSIAVVGSKPPHSPSLPKPPPTESETVASVSSAPPVTPMQSQPAVAQPPFKREAWLLKQRPDAYTLQILAAGNERAVRDFARQHQLTTDVYYFESHRNGRPWIVLLLGIYEDRNTAVTVLSMLPDPLRKAGAWPRSLASVQQEIKGER